MSSNGSLKFQFQEEQTNIDSLNSLRSDLAHNMRTFLTEAQSSGFAEEIDRMIEDDPEMEKSYKQFIKAIDKRDGSGSLAEQMVGMFVDPDFQIDTVENYSFPHERVRPEILRRAGNSIPGNLIKSYRAHQLAEFGNISNGKDAGFKISFQDTDKVPTKAEKKKIRQAEQAFKDSMFYVPNDPNPSLQKFLFYSYCDYFDLDKVAIALVRTIASANKRFGYRGEPIAMQLMDGATVYRIVPRNISYPQYDTNRWDYNQFNYAKEKVGIRPEFIDDYRFIQVDKVGKRRGIFKESEMILANAYGTTDVHNQFMGFSIVEKSLKVLRYMMDSIIYNYTRRSTQTMPKGMITLTGATEDGFSRSEMALFRKMIWAISAGKKNQWKYPVIGLPKQSQANFVKFHESSKEMEDFAWWSTLMSLFCTYSGINPEDISMASNKNTVGKQKLFDKKEEEGGMVRSQDMGLRFFLNHFATTINSINVAEEITGIEGVSFNFTGLDVEDEIKKTEYNMKKLQTDTSINELLTAEDKKPFEFMMGEINIFDIPGLANPQIQQTIMQTFQQQQMSEQEGEQEGEGDEGYPWDMGDEQGFDQDEGGGEPQPSVAQKAMKKAKKSDVIIRVID